MKKFYFFTLLFLVFNNSFAQVNFTYAQDLANYTRDVHLFDMDNDGDLDVVFGKTSGQNVIWENNGSGVFTFSSGIGPVASTNTRKLFVFDIEADGDLDIVSLENGANSVIYLNNGSGTFSTSASILTGAFSTMTGAYGDVDGDGDNDLVIAYNNPSSSNPYGVLIYKYNGSNFEVGAGSSVFSSSSPFCSFLANSINLVDYDGDNDLDIVLAESSPSTASRVYKNNGSGQFTTNFSVPVSGCNSIAAGDVDNDGDIDFVYGTTNGAKMFYNNGNGTVSNSGQTISSGNIIDVNLADINNDGYLDAVIGLWTGNEVWRNTQNSSSLYVNSGLSLGSDYTYAIATGDVNGDGKVDIVFANSDGGGSQKSDLWINSTSLSTNVFEANISVKLYPNPTTSFFRINSKQDIQKVEVYDILGKKVKAFNREQEIYNVDDLISGIYLVKIFGNKAESTVKIVKK